MLVSVMVYASCFQVSFWKPYSPTGLTHLDLPFKVYPQKAYVQPDDGHQLTPGMHQAAASSNTWSGEEPYTTK